MYGNHIFIRRKFAMHNVLEMPLSIIKRNNKEYVYFFMGASRSLYLGTSENIKIDRLKEAVQYTQDRIREYNETLQNLKDLSTSNKGLETITEPLYYKMVFFDLDGVLCEKPWEDTTDENVAISTWDILFQSLGMYSVHQKLKENFVNGEYKGDYIKWTKAACNVLKSVGLTKQKFNEIIDSRKLTQGALELFERLRSEGIKTALISGSFEALAEKIERELGGIDHTLAHCKLNFDKKNNLVSWKLRNTDYKDKAIYVEKIAKENNIPLELCAYVGDDVNDIDAFTKVGLAIAFNASKPKVRQAARVVIDSQDLRAILPHLSTPKIAIKKRITKSM